MHHSTTALSLTSLFVIAACGSNKAAPSVDGQAISIDAPRVFLDAPPVVPTTITLSGTAFEDGQSSSTPLAGVQIKLYKSGDPTTALASAVTDAQGKYSLEVATDGHVVDAYIAATKATYADYDGYPAVPFQGSSTGNDAHLITSANFGFLKLIAGQHAGNALVVVQVTDAAGAAVAGATIISSPASASYRYSDSSGTPTSTTGTAADGAAFFVDVPQGAVTVNATEAGHAFKPHAIHARPDVFTYTVITE